VNVADFIPIACVLAFLGVVLRALVMERRERKRLEELDRRRRRQPDAWVRR
jgi:hypothetical protein